MSWLNNIVGSRQVWLAAALIVLCATSSHAQWQRATLPPPYSTGYYLDVFFLPSDTRYGWACSIEGYVVRTTDGGKTWAGAIPGRAFLEYIQFLTPTIGYASGPAGIYRSNDGGATWFDITPADPNQEQSWGSYFLNQNEGVFLVGGCSTDLQAFYRTTDGGQSWTVSYGNERQSGLADALLYKDGSGYAVSSGVIWQTSDYGRHWQKRSNTSLRVWHEELAVYGKTFLIPYSGTDCSGGGANVGGMMISHDGAYTWRQFDTRQNMFGTCLINENEGWAVGDGTSAYYTNDGGNTWVNRNCGLEGDMDDVYFIGDTLGWIAGNGLYKYAPKKLGPSVTITPQGTDVSICASDSVLLTASFGYSSYTWSDGVVGQARYAKSAGRYTVYAYDKATCEQSEATITVQHYSFETPRISAGVTDVCEGDSVRLDYVGTEKNITWSTGETTPSIYVKATGRYSITVVDQHGCTELSIPVNIVVHPLPQPVILANRRTTICLDESVILSAPPGLRTYQWNTGETTQSITVSNAGMYAVTVVDEFGCVGSSDSMRVVVLDVRNMVDVQSILSVGAFELPAVAVGEVSCRSLTIRNKSLTEDLVIRHPVFTGNVFFSIPPAQLPIRIPPMMTGELQLCSTPIDTGLISDTLILSDTCSPTVLPVSCRGNAIAFTGTSRCELPVDVLVIRAGVSHYLSSPYPLPASEQFQLSITPSLDATACLIDPLGMRVAEGTRTAQGNTDTYTFDVAQLSPGRYIAVIQAEGTIVRGYPVVIVR